MSMPLQFRGLFPIMFLSMMISGARGQDATDVSERFSVGFAKREITPQKPMPMWGYGARHDVLSQGVLTPLFAKAIVIQAGEEKLALVGLDIGRGPTRDVDRRLDRKIAEKGRVEDVGGSGSNKKNGR